MAIAPFEEGQGGSTQETDRRLRVINGGRSATAGPRRIARHAAPMTRDVPNRSRDAHPSAQRLTARPRREAPVRALDPNPARALSARLQPGASTKNAAARRRRAAGFGVALAAVVLLALPLRALGAVTLDGQVTPGGVPAGLAPGSTIVIQPGETIHSVSMRVNPGDAASIARALVAEVGSRTLVAGEHVIIP